MSLSCTTVQWRGLTLSSDHSSPFGVRSLRGWDELPSARYAAAPRPSAHGGFDSPVWSDERIVTLVGQFLSQDRDALLAELGGAMTWSRDAEPLVVTRAGRTLTARARLTAFLTPTELDWSVGLVPFSIEWRCPDPLRYAEPVGGTTGFPRLAGGLRYELYTSGTVLRSTVYDWTGVANASTSTERVDGALTRTNLIPIPRPTVYPSGWAMPGTITFDSGWIVGTLTTTTVPFCFTDGAETAIAAGDVVTIAVDYRVDALPAGSSATHIKVTPHKRTGNAYYEAARVVRPIVLGQTERVVITWTATEAIAVGDFDIALVGSNASGGGRSALAGFAWRVRRPTIERGTTSGTYFDGDTPDTTVHEHTVTGWLDYGEASDTGRLTLDNPGTADTWPQFQMAGPVDDEGFQIVEVGTGRVIEFKGPVPAGSVLLVDSATGTAVLDGVADRGGQLTRRDWFPVPAGGSLEVALIPLGADLGGTLTATCRPAWW